MFSFKLSESGQENHFEKQLILTDYKKYFQTQLEIELNHELKLSWERQTSQRRR